jgi:DNA polymerase-1
LKAGRFANQAHRLRLFRKIATMDAKAPLPRIFRQNPTWSKAASLAASWDLEQLARRLTELSCAEPKSKLPKSKT